MINYAEIIKSQRKEFTSNFFPNKPGIWGEEIRPFSDNKEPKISMIDIHEVMNKMDANGFNTGFPDLNEAFANIVNELMSTGACRRIANFGALLGGWSAPFLKYPFLDSLDVYEIRKLDIIHPKITVHCQDLSTQPIENFTESYDIISAIDSISHAGLGRYSSNIDPDADIKMGQRIVKLLRPKGYFILSLTCPLEEKHAGIIFNTQRNYSQYRINLLTDGLLYAKLLTEDTKLQVLRKDVPCVRRLYLFQKP